MVKNILKNFFKKKDLLGGVKEAFMTGHIKTDFDFKNYAKKNIFNNLSKKSEYGFYYWPYGFLFRYPKWGGINDLGFRNNFNFNEVNLLFKNHYKIGFFGGSTGFDILVKNEDSIVYKLEKKLNQNQKLVDKYGNIKIINYSQPGGVLMNQIVNYIQFGELCTLQMIISHNPTNDYVSPMINDPILIKNYKLGYNDILPSFARKIHDADDVDIDSSYMDINSKDFKPAEPKTNPEVIIESFIFRLKQFENLVTSLGKTFISGYQPFINSKKNLSEYEKSKVSTYNPYYQKVYKAIPTVYEIFDKKYSDSLKNINLINFHKMFENLPSNISHFGDTYHLLEPGNEVIAENYYKRIVELIIN